MLLPLLLKLIQCALVASMLLQTPAYAGVIATATDPGGNTSGFSACVTVTSTGGGAPPQSDDPIFDAIDLPHDPALGPLWDGEHLTATQPDAYHADFTLDGAPGWPIGGPPVPINRQAQHESG